MEFAQLKYFMEVAKLQHITLASKHMHVAQPSITKSIHRLEEELGVVLIQKKGRNIELTEMGKLLYEYLDEPMKKIEDIPNLVHEVEEEKSRTIRLNVLAASRLVTDAIIAYKKEFPMVNFSIVQNEKDQNCDIRIDTMMDGKRQGSSSHSYFFKENILLAVPKHYKYVDKEDFCLKDVREEGFICLAGHRKFRNLCDQFCLEEGFMPKVIFESDNPTSVRNLIEAGMGIGFWPEYTWQDAGEGVVLLSLHEEKFHRHFQIHMVNENLMVEDFYIFLVHYFDGVKEKKHESNC